MTFQKKEGGPDATYQAAHHHVRRTRGWADTFECIACLGPAEQWALIHGSPGIQQDANGREFSLDPMDYQPMCRSCHLRYDRPFVTHCPQGHPYAGDNLFIDQGRRKCRTCYRARFRERYWRKKAERQAAGGAA